MSRKSQRTSPEHKLQVWETHDVQLKQWADSPGAVLCEVDTNVELDDSTSLGAREAMFENDGKDQVRDASPSLDAKPVATEAGQLDCGAILQFITTSGGERGQRRGI